VEKRSTLVAATNHSSHVGAPVRVAFVGVKFRNQLGFTIPCWSRPLTPRHSVIPRLEWCEGYSVGFRHWTGGSPVSLSKSSYVGGCSLPVRRVRIVAITIYQLRGGVNVCLINPRMMLSLLGAA